MAGWKVEVTGLRQLMSALDEIDKSATKKIRKAITDVAKVVAKDAAGRINQPMSGWGRWIDSETGRDLGFDPSVVAAGFKPKTSSYRKRGVSRGYGVDVIQTSAGGSVFEVVGDKSRTRGAQGERFVDQIVARTTSTRPRSLFPAYYAGVTPEVKDNIRDQILDEARKAGLR